MSSTQDIPNSVRELGRPKCLLSVHQGHGPRPQNSTDFGMKRRCTTLSTMLRREGRDSLRCFLAKGATPSCCSSNRRDSQLLPKSTYLTCVHVSVLFDRRERTECSDARNEISVAGNPDNLYRVPRGKTQISMAKENSESSNPQSVN